MAKQQKGFKTALVVTVVVLAALLAVFVMPQVLYGAPEETTGPKNGTTVPPETTTAPQQQTVPAGAEMELPLELENGALVVKSLFQYDGINPDCENQEAKDIASITLTNSSGSWLRSAQITLTLSDGTRVPFLVTDLPAGSSALAFAADNAAMAANAAIVDVTCEAEWDETADPLPEGISVSVDGVAITLTNRTGQQIPQLTVTCRMPMSEAEYFGGISYEYTVNDLPADGTVTVEAWDCILGMTEVVRVAVNQD